MLLEQFVNKREALQNIRDGHSVIVLALFNILALEESLFTLKKTKLRHLFFVSAA